MLPVPPVPEFRDGAFRAAGFFEPDYGDAASDWATFVLAAFEGAMVLSRAHHDTRPLRVTRDLVADMLRSARSPAAPHLAQ